MGDLLDNVRDAAGSRKDRDGKGDHKSYYTGPTYAVQLKSDNQQQPLVLTVYVDRKNWIAGIEIAGQVMPFDVVHADAGKLSSLKYVYEHGRQCIIRALSLIAPKG